MTRTVRILTDTFFNTASSPYKKNRFTYEKNGSQFTVQRLEKQENVHHRGAKSAE
jgi:hypothetical protein